MNANETGAQSRNIDINPPPESLALQRSIAQKRRQNRHGFAEKTKNLLLRFVIL
jgi:hypothetical protein